MGREVLLAGNEPPITVEYTNNGGIVKGMIRDGNRGYVALVPAEESLRDAVFIESMLTDNEGRFEFLGVRPGDYYAFAFTRLEPRAFEDADSFRQLLGSATNVRVAEGESQIIDPVLTKWPW
jgi:hypothetical protein